VWKREATGEPRWRTAAVLAIGVIVMATPASGHITSSVTHVADPGSA
jgi:hypothetical protein